MYSRSPSRNQRSKGFKVKRILQICLLVAVCFWLVYQVKRSHEKNKEFDEKDSSLVSETQNDSDILKLGRKDISRVRETVTDDKLHREDEEENEADEEENRHEEVEQEREEIRTEDQEEDIGKGGEDDEIDKHEEEQEEEKIDDEYPEGILDQENGRGEGDEKIENDDGVGKEDNEESETVLKDQDQDQDGEAKNTHGAREDHYKADDASSEVAHDTKNMNIKNSTALREFNDQSQVSNNLTQLESEHSANLFQAQNAYEDSNNEGFNKSMSLILHANASDSASDRNQLDLQTDTNDTHHVITTFEGSLSSSGDSKLALAENITGVMETKADVVNSTNAGTDNDIDTDLENLTAGESESGSSISDTENKNDNSGLDFHDPVDDLDSSLTQQENEYRTDLGTLSDIQLEVQNSDDMEAE